MVKDIIDAMGGRENIVSVTNCMTRLRFVVVNESSVKEAEMKELPDVLGLVHDMPLRYEVVVGPGKSTKYASECHQAGIPAAAEGAGLSSGQSWEENKKAVKSAQKQSGLKSFLKIFGDVFVPLIPGTIAAGLCAGFAMLISQAVPEYESKTFWLILYQLLSLINTAFMTYITAWAGYRASERFGGTPILGGMLGMITSQEGINTVSKALGLFNEAVPLESVLRAGRGGVLAAVAGAFILSGIERVIRKRMPDSIDIVFTPVLSLLLCLVPYLFIIMPALGYVSSAICWFMGRICISEIPLVRAFAGFAGAALFLPLVAAGMHHGLVALYSVQLEQLGFVTLYPALAMAGAGQVGAGIALLIKARRAGNDRLASTIRGAVPAGILGVGEPMIYGVTLPLGRPFLTAGLGAGFGGAYAMLRQVASTTWGPSGVIGAFVMTAGPNGAVAGIIHYMIGLLISCAAGGLITYLVIGQDELRPETPAAAPVKTEPPASSGVVRKAVSHGDIILSAGSMSSNSCVIRDKNGIHARPAAALVKLAEEYDCKVSVSSGGKSAPLDSVIGIMSLGITGGSRIEFHAEGPDSEEALKAIMEFVRENL